MSKRHLRHNKKHRQPKPAAPAPAPDTAKAPTPPTLEELTTQVQQMQRAMSSMAMGTRRLGEVQQKLAQMGDDQYRQTNELLLVMQRAIHEIFLLLIKPDLPVEEVTRVSDENGRKWLDLTMMHKELLLMVALQEAFAVLRSNVELAPHLVEKAPPVDYAFSLEAGMRSTQGGIVIASP
jgi:hypothetical protein